MGHRTRSERPDDADAVHALTTAAFGDDGAHVARLVDALRHEPGFGLVAEQDGVVVGHVRCTAALLDADRHLVEVMTLSPLSIAPDVQHQGIGTALLAEALRTADARGVPLVVLEGDPGYYGRRGFVAGASLGLRRPSTRIPPAAFQAVTLAAHEPWMTGTFVYPDVFWRLDCVGLRAPAPSAVEGAP